MRLTTAFPAIAAFLGFAASIHANIIIVKPDHLYVSQTTLIDISGFSDNSVQSSVSGGGQTVNFSSPMTKLSVPGTWGTWNSHPQVETDTPPILYTNGNSDIVLNLSSPARIFGFEAQPNQGGPETISAAFFGAGPAFQISLDVSGNAGALLFAVSSDTAITQVEINDSAGNDFAIANIRSAPSPLVTTPEATAAIPLAFGFLVLALWRSAGAWANFRKT